jgi:hypothetical protein
MEATVKSKWDEFLDAYLSYLADPATEKLRELERLGRELQDVDPNFKYSEFKKRVSSKQD